MTQVSKHFMNPKIEKKVYEVFINSVKNTKSSDEVIDFLNDLLTPVEKTVLSKRVAVAFMLIEDKYTYEQISRTLKVSYGTIARVHGILGLQGKGYRKTIGDILFKKTVRNSLSEFLDLLTPLPAKGTSLTTHRINKIKSRLKRMEPL